MDSIFKGTICENMAVKFYTKKGYKVLKRNYRTREGEIDIILRKDDTIVFAEVKSIPSYWNPNDFSRKINQAKVFRIKKTATVYLASEVNDVYHFVRFDAVFVSKDKLTCIAGAF